MRVIAYNINTYYQQIGKKGPIIVLLHGWGHNWQTWNDLIPFLSEKHQLLIPDLPAFGKSQSPKNLKEWNSIKYALWLNELIKKVAKNKKIILIGHSFGGKIAARYASRYPKQVKKLFLVGPSGIPNKITQERSLSLIPNWIKSIFPQQIRYRLLKYTNASSDYLNSSPDQQKILKNTIVENISADLKKIQSPTFLFWGDMDKDAPYENHQIFLRNIKKSELITFENTGHSPFLEKNDKFIKELQKRI